MIPTAYVCVHQRLGNGSCGGAGSRDLLDVLAGHLEQAGIACAVRPSTCLGRCGDGPNIKLAPAGPVLNGCVQPQDVVARIRDAVAAMGRPIAQD